MSTESLFGQLDPPAGGAERFALRLDEAASVPTAPHWRAYALAGVVSAAATLVVAVGLLREERAAVVPPLVADSGVTSEIYDSPAFDRLLGRRARPTELTVTLDEQATVVTEIATDNDKIRVYRVD